MYEQPQPGHPGMPPQPQQNPLTKDVEIAGRRLSLDIWLALGASGVMLLLCAWGAKICLSPAFEAFGEGNRFAFVFGWLFFVFGLFFVSLGFAYFWIGARLLARDPVGRWAGVALGATVVLSFVLQSRHGATGATVWFIVLLNGGLAALCAFSPGLRSNERRGQYADLPTSVALALVVARAQALSVVYVGVSVFPAGQFRGRLYVEGLLLLGVGIGLFVAAGRILDRSVQAAYLVAGIVGGGALLSVIAQRSQLSFVAFGLGAVVVWGLLGAPSSRAFYNLKPIDYSALTSTASAQPAYGQPQYPPPTGYQPSQGYPPPAAPQYPPPAAQYPPPGYQPAPSYPPPAAAQYPPPAGAQYPPAAAPQYPPPAAPQYPPPLSSFPPPDAPQPAVPQPPLSAFPAPAETPAAPVPPATPPWPEAPTAVEPAPVVDLRKDMSPQSSTPVPAAPAVSSEAEGGTIPRPSTVSLPRTQAPVILAVVGRDPITVLGPVVLGRAPQAPESTPAAVPEAVPDTDRSLSRSHLLVWPGANSGTVFVRDLGSANGSYVLDGNGASRRLEPGVDTEVQVGMSLMLGAVIAQVRT